ASAAPADAVKIIESMPAHAWSADPDGRFVYVSPGALAYLGAPAADLAPLPDSDEFGWKAVVHPDDYARVIAAWRASLATGAPYDAEHRLRRHDGVYRWFRNAGRAERDAQGRIVGWHGTTIDIDDRKRAEAALIEREHELSQLVDMVPGFLFRLAPDGEPLFFSRRMVEYFDTPAEDFTAARGGLSASVAAHVHPDDLERVVALLRRTIPAGEPFASTHRMRRADGTHRWMAVSAEPLRDDDGAILQWYGICHDIDDRLRVEEALRERERFLWQLVDTLPAMVVCAAPDGEPIYRSEQLRAYLGYGVEAFGGDGRTRLDATLEQAIHPDDLAAVKADYARSLATGAPYRRKHRLRRVDGVYRWVESRAAPMRDAGGAIVQWNLICLDVEGEAQAQQALREAQERLARASQAASLAELSASIAHEVSQPLAAVAANSQACHRWLSADPPNLERAKLTAERITRDARSAAEVVSRIRALFSQSTEARGGHDVACVIAEAQELIAEEALRRGVRIGLVIAGDLPRAVMDRVQVQQVLVNLIRNGMDAMDDAPPGDRAIRIAARAEDDAVRVEVSDRGKGIAAPERIFEPFFTTKEKGMGMGLAICRSIVESHGGRLWTEAGEGQGAVFVFTLPAAAQAAA
ncbi:MAG: PAS domain-containing protein, partial [Pseudomonadota bacterium]|nr:PAS domain-containing protein [Pseudomonadota bacterium]